MEKRTREILALVLLIALGLGVSCAMGWYLIAGHSWNQAATRIDDMVGSMDGYTVIVYDGRAKNSQANAKKAKADGPAAIEGVPPSGEAPSEGAPSSTEPAESGEPVIAEAASEKGSRKAKRLSAKAVAAEYQEKGAGVILLPKDCAKRYDEPAILYRQGRRIGLFSFPGKFDYRYAQLRAYLRYFSKHEVDFVVCIGNHKSMLKAPLASTDLLIVNRNAGIAEEGQMRGTTLCVDSPRKGEVQAIIVAPSGVITSRTIGES